LPESYNINDISESRISFILSLGILVLVVIPPSSVSLIFRSFITLYVLFPLLLSNILSNPAFFNTLLNFSSTVIFNPIPKVNFKYISSSIFTWEILSGFNLNISGIIAFSS